MAATDGAMTLLLGLLLAALSTLVSQVGGLLRQRGAAAAPDVEPRRPLHTAICLFRQKWWSIGYALAGVGYLFHLGALGLTELSLVQAVLAGGLVVLAVVGERGFGFQIDRRQWIGLSLAAGGLALLAVTGGNRSGQHSATYSPAAMVLFEAALVAAGAALILSHRVRRLREQRGVLLAVSAGLLFTVTHVAMKAASGKVDGGTVADAALGPYVPIALACAVVAFFASARSLQIGPAVPVLAFTSIAGNASSIPAGVVVFGDPLGSDAREVAVRCLAFILVVGAATLIPAPIRAARASRARGEERAAVPA